MTDAAVLSASADVAQRYRAVREVTRWLSAPLAAEDMAVQPMPDASPTKWHLAHTTWFFETFVLKPAARNYRPFHPQFEYLFNSYYNTLGPQWYRPHRGLLTRPTVAEILDYRAHVDAAMSRLLEDGAFPAPVVELGLHHEQQHQELMLTDVKYLLSQNPLRPVYREDTRAPKASAAGAAGWIEGTPGIQAIGHDGPGFAFDNEYPRHDELVRPFRIANRLVTNAEYLAFIADGGYRRAELWLSDGWTAVRERGWESPLYWADHEGGWWNYTLTGFRALDAAEPVCHVSYYEADAFARWRGARLATEAEWEITARDKPLTGNFVESHRFHPAPAPAPAAMAGRSCSVTSGNGPAVRILPIPATARWRARSVSTTRSSCAINSCCVAAPAPRRRHIFGQPIATFSLPTRAGNSAGFA